MPRFDPIRILADADDCLADFDRVARDNELHDREAVKVIFQQRFAHATRELELAREFYQRMTPSLPKIATIFVCGIGGIVFMPPTLGWSMALTLGSVGLALNDTRDFVDNRAQIHRIEMRLAWIRQAVETLDRPPWPTTP